MRAEGYPAHAGGDPEPSTHAGRDPEPNPAKGMWYNIFESALKTLMKLMPQALTNIRGMAGAEVDGLGNDPDLLCSIGTSFSSGQQIRKILTGQLCKTVCGSSLMLRVTVSDICNSVCQMLGGSSFGSYLIRH